MLYSSLFDLLRDVSRHPLKKGEFIYPTHTMPGDLLGFRLVGSDSEIVWEITQEDMKFECSGKGKPRELHELYQRMKSYMSRKEILADIKSGTLDLSRVFGAPAQAVSVPASVPAPVREPTLKESPVEDVLLMMGFGG